MAPLRHHILYLPLIIFNGLMFNVILFGPPGSGKGTQSEKITATYNLKHISTGDLLRSEIAAQSPLGLEAKKVMDRGELVPDSVVIGMISDQLEKNPHTSGFLFDGFPRTAIQARELDQLLSNKDTCIDVVLAMDVSEEELVKRLLKRGETSGRSDDVNEGIVRARIEEYRKKTRVVLDHYDEQGRVVHIAGEGSIDQIFERLKTELDLIKKQQAC